MSLTDIKTRNRGFTIVELLIVVVVIAILAAITIVSYNGITNRANASSAKAAAATMQKKIELYQTENSRYPVALSEMTASTSNTWYIAASAFTVDGAAPSATDGKTRVKVASCGATSPDSSSVTGARITYYDYEAKTTANIDLGTCTTVGTNSATAWDGQ